MRSKSIRFEVELTEGEDRERAWRLSCNGGLKYIGVNKIGNKAGLDKPRQTM